MLKRSLLMTLLALIATFAGLSLVTADAPVEGRAGRAEMRFLEGMTDHHALAIDMANDCLAKATTESVLTLCQNVIDAQSPEIALMQGWLLDWYNISYTPVSVLPAEEGGMEGMDHGAMEGMPATDPAMAMGMFAGFNRLEGVEYEIAWLESMQDHHSDAIHMAERILKQAPEGVGHAELRDLAQKIITDQSAEIEAMEAMITELAG